MRCLIITLLIACSTNGVVAPDAGVDAAPPVDADTSTCYAQCEHRCLDFGRCVGDAQCFLPCLTDCDAGHPWRPGVGVAVCEPHEGPGH